jgi:methylase of polypeptide subunit release factors
MSLGMAESYSPGLFAYSERDVAVDQLHAATAIYTTSNVIDPLLQRVGWPNQDRSLFDPACGDGAFLVQAIRLMKSRRDDLAALARIRGWEIHPQAVADARTNVEHELVCSGWTRSLAARAAHQVVVQDDFLAPSRALEPHTLVAGNPPYLRFGNLPDYFKGVYSERLPDYAKGDLLHAFLDGCRSITARNGAAAFVTADRWLFNVGAASLRETLGQYFGIEHLCRLDASTSFYRPKDRSKGSLPRIFPVEVVLRPRDLAPLCLSRMPIYPDSDIPTSESGLTLQDICSISIGPWLGAWGVFVVDEITAKQLPSCYLVPCVDTDDLDYERGCIKRPSKFAIATERDTCPEESVAAHLRQNMWKMPPRAIRDDGRYWIPPERIPQNLDQYRLIVPRIARELKTVVVPPGVLAINHNLSVCALNGHDLRTVQHMITCERSQEWFRKTADRLENGYFSVKTRTLRNLPI